MSACASAPESDTAPAGFKSQIRWAGYGIPHVKADDWAGMGYGFAYATATDGLCVIAHDVMTVNGDLSCFLGPENGNLDPRGMLTYSQSQEPESDHYDDLTRLYSAGRWIRFPFSETEIQADPELSILELIEQSKAR